MRIIAGKHRGRVLKEFNGRDIRPTSDRAKEALFNILQFEVVFVDNSRESVKLLKENLANLKEKAEIYEGDALAYVAAAVGKFDFVFLDPPYAIDAKDVVSSVAKNGLLKEGGRIIYEHSGKSLGDIDGVRLVDSRVYGIAVFDFYECL